MIVRCPSCSSDLVIRTPWSYQEPDPETCPEITCPDCHTTFSPSSSKIDPILDAIDTVKSKELPIDDLMAYLNQEASYEVPWKFGQDEYYCPQDSSSELWDPSFNTVLHETTYADIRSDKMTPLIEAADKLLQDAGFFPPPKKTRCRCENWYKSKIRSSVNY